jgi:hypothetical protein
MRVNAKSNRDGLLIVAHRGQFPGQPMLLIVAHGKLSEGLRYSLLSFFTSP